MKTLSEETKARVKSEIDRVALAMALEEDPEKLDRLSNRYRLLNNLLEKNWAIKPDTVAMIGANLLGILLILNHERLDIVSTKALGFISKIRV